MLSKIICTIQPLEESMAAIVLWNKSPHERMNGSCWSSKRTHTPLKEWIAGSNFSSQI